MPFILNNALILIPIALILVFLFAAIRVIREYERAVVFQLGRFWKVKGPGLILVIPVIQQAVKVDLRIRVHDIPSQDIISRDNVLVKVNAVVYYRVIDARNAIIQVEDFNNATSQLAQTTLRSVLGQHELDQMLAERDKLNADLQRILDEQTESWGIKVSNVELKHVDIDESMIRVIARQAEAERIRRAKIIELEGEFQAAQKFLDAATILSERPEAMQLRYLSTLMTIANERSSTIVFPFPTDLGQMLSSRARARRRHLGLSTGERHGKGSGGGLAECSGRRSHGHGIEAGAGKRNGLRHRLGAILELPVLAKAEAKDVRRAFAQPARACCASGGVWLRPFAAPSAPRRAETGYRRRCRSHRSRPPPTRNRRRVPSRTPADRAGARDPRAAR